MHEEEGTPGGPPRDASRPRRPGRRVALRVLLGVAGAAIFVVGALSEGPLAVLSAVVGGAILVVVVFVGIRSGWVLV